MSKITDALAKLDPANDNHWTSDGLPRIDTVRMLAADQTLSRELITAEAPNFSRTSVAKAPDTPPVVPPVVPPVPPMTPAEVAASVSAALTSVQEGAGATTETESDSAGMPSVETEQVGEDASFSEADYDLMIEQAQKNLQDTINIRNAAQAVVNVAQNELDDIINEKHAAAPGTSTAMAIQGYLASQQESLTERGRRARVLQESGVTLRDIQALIPQASPLDQALTSKKR